MDLPQAYMVDKYEMEKLPPTILLSLLTLDILHKFSLGKKMTYSLTYSLVIKFWVCSGIWLQLLYFVGNTQKYKESKAVSECCHNLLNTNKSWLNWWWKLALKHECTLCMVELRVYKVCTLYSYLELCGTHCPGPRNTTLMMLEWTKQIITNS